MSEVIGGKQMARKRAKNKPKDVALPRQRSPLFRSRVSRGLDLLPDIDGRVALGPADAGHVGRHGRALRRPRRDQRNSPHDGSPRRLPRDRAHLPRNQFATIRAAGGEPDLGKVEIYGRLAGNQRRIAEALGWERSQKDVTPDPLTYAANYNRRTAFEAEELEEDAS